MRHCDFLFGTGFKQPQDSLLQPTTIALNIGIRLWVVPPRQLRLWVGCSGSNGCDSDFESVTLNPHKTSSFLFTQVSNCHLSALSHSFSLMMDPLSIHPHPLTPFYLLIESDSLSNLSISDQTWSQSLLQANSDSELVSLPYVVTWTLSRLLYALGKHLVFLLFFIQQIQHHM